MGGRRRNLAQEVKEESLKPVTQQLEILKPYIPTGSVMLNLACAELISIGFSMGKMTNVIGDSHAGKTLLVLSMLAEVANMKTFDEWNLYYDDVEHALEFDIRNLFGSKAEERIIAPRYNGMEEPEYSNSMDDLQNTLFNILDTEKPFIYVLDSFDALTGKEEEKNVREKLRKRLEGKDVAGSYGDGKAKSSHEMFRLIVKRLKKSKGLFVVVSQTKVNLNAGLFGKKKIRNGGSSLDFYATHIIWLAVKQRLYKDVKKVKREYGAKIKAEVSKNKLTGKRRSLNLTIRNDYGIDNITSCIDFLVETKHWPKSGVIHAKELKVKMTEKDLIDHIESKNLERKLYKITEKVWMEIEESLKPDRKRKFK